MQQSRNMSCPLSFIGYFIMPGSATGAASNRKDTKYFNTIAQRLHFNDVA